ncbi:CAP domain-containing protein [Bythopirellula goksoeyrii]|uniref:Cysteine-rich secretory protein family protein n=1 Tax=Bythopirellula goksoeyrii TaxID=1400387 RepID=A0A5B9QB12_9BACT|nr:CAP domain-containing protein [Bythopirellula goksoeyrii]QEG36217.1 Cysteine-rich secretory protein family protein [Bythopirellula goksoeyrii]
MKPKTTKHRVIILPLPIWVVVNAVSLVWQLSRFIYKSFQSATATDPLPPLPNKTTHQTDPACAQMAWLLFAKLNYYRLTLGLPQVVWNEKLEQSSLYHNGRMIALGEFEHVLSDGVEVWDRITKFGYKYSACAENLAYWEDPRLTVIELAESIHQGWIDSPGHQRNLVGDYHEVGIGVVKQGHRYYATQNFGTPRTVFSGAMLSAG